jgi:hypothetical protein
LKYKRLRAHKKKGVFAKGLREEELIREIDAEVKKVKSRAQGI